MHGVRFAEVVSHRWFYEELPVLLRERAQQEETGGYMTKDEHIKLVRKGCAVVWVGGSMGQWVVGGL